MHNHVTVWMLYTGAMCSGGSLASWYHDCCSADVPMIIPFWSVLEMGASPTELDVAARRNTTLSRLPLGTYRGQRQADSLNAQHLTSRAQT